MPIHLMKYYIQFIRKGKVIPIEVKDQTYITAPNETLAIRVLCEQYEVVALLEIREIEPEVW